VVSQGRRWAPVLADLLLSQKGSSD
jgi:hypothetical protein